MKRLLLPLAAGFSLMMLNTGAASAAPVVVASFNMAWAGTPADFQAHMAACQAVAWCDSTPKREKGANAPTPEAQATAQKCDAALAAKAGGALQASMLAPCNAYRTGNPVQYETMGNYGEKLAGLQATVADLIENDGVQVLAFQGVKSEAVVRAALGQYGARFDTCAALHTSFESVALAWDRSLSRVPGVCNVRGELAVREDPADSGSSAAAPPGLSVLLLINGARTTFMTLQLKPGCANLRASGPGPDAGRTLDDPDPACRILNRQVPELEDWIDAVARSSPRFVLLGDFNRRIDDEATFAVPAAQVRSDGSDPAGVNKREAQGYVASRYLWPEISDGKPTLYQVPLGTVEAGCGAYAGLDHIVLSAAVQALQSSRTLTSRKVSVARAASQPIDTSDHCPRVVRLQL